MKLPRILIAGTASGVGKTTSTVGIIAALRKRGYRVHPYKVGPDYIDPGYLTQAAGSACRNLDSWMTLPETVKDLFSRNSSPLSIAIIEGVMGLYDGYEGLSEQGSTAEVSKLLRSPVVLILDANNMARSSAAVVLGYKAFDAHVNLAGVIINRVSNPRHYKIVKDAIKQTNIPVLGYLSQNTQIAFEEQRLGLVPAIETRSQEKIDNLAEMAEKTLDIEAIINISHTAPSLEVSSPVIFSKRAIKKNVRIAVAKDKAFNFYYQENLELLEVHGAQIVNFSPLKDKELPAGSTGLYIGGGFPEVYAKELALNERMKADIRNSVESGMPAYAECGGMAYLSREIIDFEACCHPMVGVIPLSCRMGKRLTMGYRTIELFQDNIIGYQGNEIRGHEFHYSNLVGALSDNKSFSHAYVVCEKGRKSKEGLVYKNLLASYIHLNFYGFPFLARNFVESCTKWQKEEMSKIYDPNTSD